MFTSSLTVSTNSLLFEILADRCSSHCYLWWPIAQHTCPNRFIHPFTHIQSPLSAWNKILWFFELESLLTSLFSFSPSQIPTERLKVVLGPILFQICASNTYICAQEMFLMMMKAYVPLHSSSIAMVTLSTPFPLPNVRDKIIEWVMHFHGRKMESNGNCCELQYTST